MRRFFSWISLSTQKPICGLFLAAVTLTGAAALAETPGGPDVTATKAATLPVFSTSSHLGFAVADQSSTGFRSVAGSLIFLDITQPVAKDLDLGLRSLGEGGRGSRGEFYRLGAGPLLSWRVAPSWVIQGALALFNEAGLATSGAKAYQSRGQELMLGWEKSWNLAPRVVIAWGGFATYHRGSYEAHQAASAGGPLAAAASLNAGLSHGVEVALRLRL